MAFNHQIEKNKLRLRLVRVKAFPKKKMFSCVWLHFKKCFEKYFLVFGYVLENTIENIFSTCCSHFLTFSRLPNKYIISFIPQYRNTNKTQKKNHQIQSNPVTFSHIFSVAKRIYNIIHSSLQTQTKPRKKKSLNLVKLREEGRKRGDWVRRGVAIGTVLPEITIGAKARLRSAWCFVTVGLCLAR